MSRFWLVGFFGVLILSGEVKAGVPNRIIYQGRLSKQGVSVSGAHTFSARLLSAGGAGLWSSGNISVTLPPTGDFTLTLSPTDIDWLNDDPKLEISVDGEILAPSDKFASNPYALTASSAAMAITAITASSATFSTNSSFAVTSTSAAYAATAGTALSAPSSSTAAYAHMASTSAYSLISSTANFSNKASSLSYSPAFRVYNGVKQSITRNAVTTLQFPTEEFDSSNSFSASVFTAQESGIYFFETSIFVSGANYSATCNIQLTKNGVPVRGGPPVSVPSNTGATLTFSYFTAANAMDVFGVSIKETSNAVFGTGLATTPTFNDPNSNVWFLGFRVN